MDNLTWFTITALEVFVFLCILQERFAYLTTDKPNSSLHCNLDYRATASAIKMLVSVPPANINHKE